MSRDPEALPMASEDPGPVGRAVMARRATAGAWGVYSAARDTYRHVLALENEAVFAAVISVDCPSCEAPAGERCRNRPGYSFHRNITCPPRAEASGLQAALRKETGK